MIHKIQPNNFYRVKFCHPALMRYFFCMDEIYQPEGDELVIYYLGNIIKYIPDYSRVFYSFLYNGKMCMGEDDTGIFARRNTFELME